MNTENNYTRHDGSDYYYHLVDVTQYILNTIPSIDQDTITSALLHDYLEDGVFLTLNDKNIKTLDSLNYEIKEKDLEINKLKSIIENI